MIHKTDDGYVMSESNVWRLGFFETKQVARLAANLSDEEIQALQTEANKSDGVVREEMINQPSI